MGILDDAIREHLELKRQHGAPDEELAKQEAEALGPARRQPSVDLDVEPDVDEPTDPMAPPDAGTAASLSGDAPPRPPAFDREPELELEETAVFDEPLHAEPSPADPLEPPPAALEPEPDFDLEPEPEPADDPEPAPAAYRMPEPEPDFEREPEFEPEPEIEPVAADPEPGPLDFPEPVPESHDPDPFDPPTEIAMDDATRVRPTIPIHDDPSLPPEPALPRRREADLDPDAEIEPPPGEDVLEETPDFLQDTPEHDRLWFEQKPPRDFDFDD